MKKSLFAKYFTVCTIIILSSLIFLGSVFAILMSRYVRTEREDFLSQNVSTAVNFTVYNYQENGGRYINQRIVRQFYLSVSNTVNGIMFLTDANGNTLICTDEGLCGHKSIGVPAQTLEKVNSVEEYQEYGKFNGVYDKMYYTVGRAIKLNDNSAVIGYLFCSISADTISSLVYKIVQMFLIACLFSVILSCIIIYVTTSYLSRPLKQMSKAAKSFGQGDFSARITYHSSDEIGNLAKSFNQMADSLAELENTRVNFIANVSHELKTPMTTIGGFIDGILDGTIDKKDEDKYLKLVSDEIKRLSRLVRAMLNVARIEAGQTEINFTDIDIRDLVITTLFNFENVIEDKKIEVRGLEQMPKILVLGDKDLTHQIVYNLIDNAVKFCNEGGYLEFTVDTELNLAKIHIKNSGKGISRNELNHIFDRFYKTDKSRSLDKNGVGLGLHIVKSLIDMQKGTITVGSVDGQYTEFIIGLPLYKSNEDKNSNEHKFLKKS